MGQQETAQPIKVLIGDDQPDVLRALRLLFKSEGYAIETASTAAMILEAVRRSDFDAILMDMNYVRGNTSGKEGLDLLSDDVVEHGGLVQRTGDGSHTAFIQV